MGEREWKEVRIKEICDRVSSGGTPSRKNASYYENGIYNWVKTQELRDCNIYHTSEKITEEALKNSSAKLYPANTVSMAMYGATVGKLGILKVESATNQACCNMVVDSKNYDYRYLYYNLIYNREELVGLASGAAQQNLNVGVISNFVIKIPTLEEQKAIATTLSCLDDRIELNNRINRTLEEIAQAIFKSWFVDFEPFQDGEFEDSELGRIPKGWRVGTLGDIASITSGKRPLKKEDTPTKEMRIPVVGASNVMGYTNKALYKENILITGRVGTHGVIQRFNNPCWPSDNTLIIRSEKHEFVYQVLKNVDFKSMNRGSTQPLITQTDLKNVTIVIPPDIVLENFETIISELMILLKENNNQNQTLITIRDTLLPKLMNREVRVPIVGDL